MREGSEVTPPQGSCTRGVLVYAIRMRKLTAALFLACALLVYAVDQPTYDKIKAEEMEHSQIMHTLHVLTDRYGPRLTGSPNFENAANWVVKQFSEWGFSNAH